MRLAIVGCGDIARYIALFARLDWRIRLVACCDRTLPNAKRFAARYRIPRAYDDYQALLDNEESLDALYLSVPHDLHLEMVRAAIQSGRHVLCEKPIARTIEEGEEIVRLARAAQVRVGVNYQYRYDAGCYALAMAARRGHLGQLYYGRSHVPWHRDTSYFERGPWRGQIARAGGGTLITQGSHAVDILLWAFGSSPRAAIGLTAKRKFTQVEVEDVSMGIIELANGATLQVTSAMVAAPEQAVTIEVYGERGTALYRSRPRPQVRFLGTRVKRVRPPVWGLHALQRSLGAFRAWVMNDRPYLIPAEEALPALAAVSAIYRSAQSGKKEVVSLHDPNK